MTPQTVNAYYNPGMNEIVFPAAILQPPFFDVTVTRRLIMQKARCHSIAELQPLVSVRFQVLLSPRYSRCFSPFLHSTGSLSVSQECLALPDGAGKFKRGVSNPALLRILPLPLTSSYGSFFTYPFIPSIFMFRMFWHARRF